MLLLETGRCTSLAVCDGISAARLDSTISQPSRVICSGLHCVCDPLGAYRA